MWDALNLLNTQNPQIGFPLVISEQWVIVRTEVVRNTLGRNSLVEHEAQGDTINVAGMEAKADDTPRELIHDHKHPVALQKNGFTSKQVNAPKTVLTGIDPVSKDWARVAANDE